MNKMLMENFTFCSASSTISNSPDVILQDEANLILASASQGGVAEPITDSSNFNFFPHNNIYCKL